MYRVGTVERNKAGSFKQTNKRCVRQVNELKQELEARAQTSKGLKSQLQARLQKLLKAEEDAEGATTSSTSATKTAAADGEAAEGEDAKADKSEVGIGIVSLL